MKRGVLSLAAVLLTWMSLSAQTNSFQPALRLGVGQHLDLDYAWYSEGMGRDDIELGIKTGLGLGFFHRVSNVKIDEQFTNRCLEKGKPFDVDYQIFGTAKCREQQLQLEVPMLFSLKWRGLYANAGFRLAFPFINNQWRQDINDLVIRVKDVKTGVTIANTQTNEKVGWVYGQATEQQLHQAGPETAVWVKFIAAAEIGYEWKLGDNRNYDINHSIGIGAYIDYSFAQVGEPLAVVSKEPISITPILNDKYAEVMVSRACNAALVTRIPDVGVRVHYSLVADATTRNGRRGGYRRSFYSPRW